MKRRRGVRPRTVAQGSLAVLVKRWYVVAAVTLVALGGMLGASLAAPPEYRASASVVVTWPRSGQAAVVETAEATRLASLRTLAAVAGSRVIRERALDRLAQAGAEAAPDVQASRALGARIVFGTDLILIEARGRTPEAASALANAAADALIGWHVEARRVVASARRRAIEAQLADVAGQVHAAETAWVEFGTGGAARALLGRDVDTQGARLARNLKVAEETYLALAHRLHDARIAEASVIGNLDIVDPAVPPTVPAMPRPLVNPVHAVLGGMALGVGAAYASQGLAGLAKRAQAARDPRAPGSAALPADPRQAIRPLPEGAAS